MQQNQEADVIVQLRLNNAAFKCRLCETIYNIKHEPCYAITEVIGVNQNPQGTMIPVFNGMIICETCWNKNSKGKGFDFKEPSKIVVPKNSLPHHFN